MFGRFPSAIRLALVVLPTLLSLPTSTSFALDPHRALTQYIHRIWQLQQGLPQGSIFVIHQTRDGYLWLGTQNGLFRFDGVRFTTIDPAGDVALDKVWVRDLCEDADGNLWIATDGAGLFRFKDGVAEHFGREQGLPSDNIRCLLADNALGVLVGTDRGISLPLGQTFQLDHLPDRVDHEEVVALCRASDGSVWAAHPEGVSVADENPHFSPRPLESLPPGATIHALHGDADGAIWIGTSRGLIRLRDGEEKLFTVADGLPDNEVYSLTGSQIGALWVGTQEGFSRLINGEIRSFRKRDGLSQSTVYALCEDREGSLWVGTKNGLNQFLDRRTIPFTTSEGLPTNEVGPVCQGADGDVWVGTLGAGLARFDGRNFTVLTTADGLPSNTITALAIGAANELWVGGDQGLCLLRDRQVVETFTTEQGLPPEPVQCVLRTSDGAVWIGSLHGVAMLRDGRFVAPVAGDGAPHMSILALHEYQGELLVATEGKGLLRFHEDKFEPLALATPLKSDVDALCVDQDGLLWLGSRGAGLTLIDGTKSFTYSIKDGLYDNDIYGLADDDQGRLWMACSKGIFSIPRTDLRRFAAGEIKSFSSIPFSPTDALRTIECIAGVQPAAWKMPDGRVWFSTTRGVIAIDANHLERKLLPPPVVVEEVTINGRGFLPHQVGRVPPGQTNLSFRYTALNLRIPGRLTFRYRLEGFDQDWVEAGVRREAFYTNLPPGQYRFRVAARNVDADWHELEKPITLTLEPHFYQRTGFWPACVALAAAAGWGLYRRRVRRINQHMALVLAERGRIARELHDTLMQGFSGVTMEMQALLARLHSTEDRQTLEEIIRDAAACLREARRSIAGLRNSAGPESGLAASLAQAAKQLTETRDVRLRLHLSAVPPGLPADLEYNLLRIAQEAISNAAQHAAARTIDVTLDSTADRIRLEVKDDGRGMARDEIETTSQGHFGLVGMRERTAQIGGQFRLESAPGQGTTVSVTAPIQQPGATVLATETRRVSSSSEHS